MIIFGDGIHNLMDGLSLGAAFNHNLLGALSISLSVFSEEFPHELGKNFKISFCYKYGFTFFKRASCFIRNSRPYNVFFCFKIYTLKRELVKWNNCYVTVTQNYITIILKYNRTLVTLLLRNKGDLSNELTGAHMILTIHIVPRKIIWDSETFGDRNTNSNMTVG